ncbi:MAG TPA: ABC transporter substrate-binding protein [Usitatibacter sp.]|jgi:iron complex transport system substrate-binding protein
MQRPGARCVALFVAFTCAAIDATARTVTDIANRTVELPEVVKRVADPWHANNAIVFMLGGADRIVATSNQAARQPWLKRLYPPIEAVPVAFSEAGDANIETLAAARPDVILMAYGGTPPRWLPKADALHIPVVLMPNTSLADLKTTALMTGQVLGGDSLQRASEFVRYFDANIARVERVTSAIPASERVKVLHTASNGVFSVDGRDTLVDDWIRVAGGVNAATVTGNIRTVSIEQILAWNPDVIIVGNATNDSGRRQILDDPRWREVKAVREGRVYTNPVGAYLWDRHSAESALQVLWAAKTLYPSRFADLDIERETREFYARFFRYALSPAELRSILEATPPPFHP